MGVGMGTVDTYSGMEENTEGVPEKMPLAAACSRAAFRMSISCCVFEAKKALRQLPLGQPVTAVAGLVAAGLMVAPDPPCAITFTRAGLTALAKPTTSVSARCWKGCVAANRFAAATPASTAARSTLESAQVSSPSVTRITKFFCAATAWGGYAGGLVVVLMKLRLPARGVDWSARRPAGVV